MPTPPQPFDARGANTVSHVTDPDRQAAELNTNVAHPARVYDYWLGGKDNLPADRAAAEAVLTANPAVRPTVQENRAFLRRVVRFLATATEVRQFLDIGTGIPTSPNVHEVAQAAAPEARVVQPPLWRPDGPVTVDLERVSFYAGVGRKP
jgi:hypothetical protein